MDQNQAKVHDRSENPQLRAPGGDIYLYVISLIAAVGGFLFGYDLSIITGAVLVLKGQFTLTLGQEAWALGSASVGCILGPFLGPFLSDSVLGRKWTLMIAAAVFMAGTIGTALAHAMFDFNLYRILGGIGVGLASVVSPMYIAETSPARIRGRLVTLNQLAIVVGSTASVIVAYFLLKTGMPDAWRWMFASACVPGLILIVGLFFVPHSPRWLVEKNRLPEARSVLIKTDGAENADLEIKDILASIHEEKGNIWELFSPGVRVALLIAVGLAFFQQWTGVSTLTFYAPIIYQKAGFTQVSGAIGQTVIMNIFNIIVTVISVDCRSSGPKAAPALGSRRHGPRPTNDGHILLFRPARFLHRWSHVLLHGNVYRQFGSARVAHHVRGLSHTCSSQRNGHGFGSSLGLHRDLDLFPRQCDERSGENLRHSRGSLLGLRSDLPDLLDICLQTGSRNQRQDPGRRNQGFPNPSTKVS